MAEPSASESSPGTDRDFDPTAEMLVNDFDDERTLEEEEAMESSEDAQNELDELQKEGDMPIEDLLSMYGYGDATQADNTQSSSSEEILSNQDLTLDKDEIARDLLQMDDQSEKDMSVNDLLDSVDSSVSTSRLLRSAVSHHQSESESESDNEDYVPDDDDDWKKTIQVGSEYQAVIPEGLCKYDGAPAYENDDKLLWDPSKVVDILAEEYLRKCQQPLSNCAQGVHAIPAGSHVRDDEQALYLLLQCGHNIEEAMRRRRMQAALQADAMSLWSEEECRSFENGLRVYGKDFHLIQQNKVRTRSVGELVQFYYLWKKTERHDVFANKTRLEKKKYALHPGTTDYMDRFLDEQENPSCQQHRDRSSSPNVHSLISGDHKRQYHNRTPPSSSSVATAPPVAVPVSTPANSDEASRIHSSSFHPHQQQQPLQHPHDDQLPQRTSSTTTTTMEGTAISMLLSGGPQGVDDHHHKLMAESLESLSKLASRDVVVTVSSREPTAAMGAGGGGHFVNFTPLSETSNGINNNNDNGSATHHLVEINHSFKNFEREGLLASTSPSPTAHATANSAVQ